MVTLVSHRKQTTNRTIQICGNLLHNHRGEKLELENTSNDVNAVKENPVIIVH